MILFQFGDEGFHEKDDAAFCKDCYFEQFAPKCGGCNTPITENYISSLNLQVCHHLVELFWVKTSWFCHLLIVSILTSETD